MLEKPLLQKYKAFIIFYKRFIDDMNLLWSGSELILKQFFKELNELDKAGRIKVKWIISHQESVFLDLLIYKQYDISITNKLETRTYQKPLNVYGYIPFRSFHPSHTKKSIYQRRIDTICQELFSV